MEYVAALALVLLSFGTGSQAQGCTSGFKANPSNCSTFFQCSQGAWVQMSCQSGLCWNAALTYCDWPASCGCTSGGSTTQGPPTTSPTTAPTTSPTTARTTTSAPIGGNGGSGSSCSASTYPAVVASMPPAIPDSAPASGITWSQFSNAVTFNGYTGPCLAQYNAFMAGLPVGSITTVGEAAMFLANVMHESGGLLLLAETACEGAGGCPNSYQYTWGSQSCLVPGVQYFGRGYLQLTWCYNYGWFSKSYFGNTHTLLQNPAQVASNETLAWASAFWYWQTRVHGDPMVAAMNFGATINDINGAIECSGGPTAQAQQRMTIYQQIRTAFGLTVNAANTAGCPPSSAPYQSIYATEPCYPLD